MSIRRGWNPARRDSHLPGMSKSFVTTLRVARVLSANRIFDECEFDPHSRTEIRAAFVKMRPNSNASAFLANLNRGSREVLTLKCLPHITYCSDSVGPTGFRVYSQISVWLPIESMEGSLSSDRVTPSIG